MTSSKNNKKRNWLMKTEPSTYSVEDLKKHKTTWWEGVRNYQARNFMMNDMVVGDTVLFYHSSCEVPGVYALAEVSAAAKPDQSQFQSKSEYHDPKATKEKPIWFCTEVKFKKELKTPVTLAELRENKKLKDMVLLQRGSRLSIQPVTDKELEEILKMSDQQS